MLKLTYTTYFFSLTNILLHSILSYFYKFSMEFNNSMVPDGILIFIISYVHTCMPTTRTTWININSNTVDLVHNNAELSLQISSNQVI